MPVIRKVYNLMRFLTADLFHRRDYKTNTWRDIEMLEVR